MITAQLPPALRALAELPRDRLELLAEVVVALLDATSPDPEREFDADDFCEAGECGNLLTSRNLIPGDSEDDEPDDPREEDDPPESDNEDCCEAQDDRIEGAPIYLASDDEDREPEDFDVPGVVPLFPRMRRFPPE